ncbi:hypothetical protein AB835_08275 [Candidatus Endobugula sertula]|uniref:Uncharacterized protein n=1 Tax=Candidatus Endobugula sertula TaxID=62101 RepID=A0A1D2QPS6_9GAMM|nr:hypothetical protein AB835_08275 [Candidatus Endobugula sertula]
MGEVSKIKMPFTPRMYGNGNSLYKQLMTDRLNESDYKVIDGLSTDQVFFDAKGDYELVQELYLMMKGQLPHIEWLKQLPANSKPPRGRCQRWAKNNPGVAERMKTMSYRDDSFIMSSDA